jgi:hypothetical protein
MRQMKTIATLIALALPGFFLLQAAGQTEVEPDQPIQDVIDEKRYEADRERLFAESERFSSEELAEILRNLRAHAEEEARWAQFMDWTMWYVRDSCDQKAHSRWKSTWSGACHDLLGQTIFVLGLLDNCFEEGKLVAVSEARVHYSFIAAALPQIREARLKVSRGVLIDVYKMPSNSPRLATWASPPAIQP